jgi:hypothetical protein
MKLRRTVIVLSIVLAIALAVLPAPGARAEGSPLELGVKAGLSMASFFWLENNAWNDLTGFVFHPVGWLYAAVNLTPGLALQVELGYAGRGASIDATLEHARWYFDYVEVPIWLRFQDTDPQLRVYGGLGGYGAYMFHGAYDFFASSVSLSGTGELVLDGAASPTHARQIDYGLLASAGIESNGWIAEFRFVIGLASVLDFTLVDGSRRTLNGDVQLLIGRRL